MENGLSNSSKRSLKISLRSPKQNLKKNPGCACRRICSLCQQTSPNQHTTSNCDVTNSAHQIQMTTSWHWITPPRTFVCVGHCSHHLRFMTTGEDRSKNRFIKWKFCGIWKLPFRHHGAIMLTQNCVCFSNLCINLFVPTSITLEYHPKVLERLHLLQCISAHLQKTLPWASWETQCLKIFSADFRSYLVTRSRKPIKCVLKTVEKIHACSTKFAR